MSRDNKTTQFREILQAKIPPALLQKTQKIIDGARINEYQPEVEIEQGNDNLNHHLNNFFEIACKISGFEQTTNMEKLCETLNAYFEILKEMEKEYGSPKQLHNNRQITFMALIVFHNRIIREKSDFQDHFFETILSNITNKYNNLTFDEVQVLSYIADCLQNPDLQKRKISKIFDDGKLTLDEILKLTADGEHLLAYKGAKLIKNFSDYDPKAIIPIIIKKQNEKKDEQGNLSLLLLELIKEDPDANQYLLGYLGQIIQTKTEIQNHKTLLIELLNSQKIVSITDKMLLLISLVGADIDEELKDIIKTKIRGLFLEEKETPIRMRCFLLTSLTERGFLSFENEELKAILTKIVEDLNYEKDLNIKNRILRHFITYKIISPDSKEAKEIAGQLVNDLTLDEKEKTNTPEKLRILQNLINRKLIDLGDEDLKGLIYQMLKNNLPRELAYPNLGKKIEVLESLSKEKIIDIKSAESKKIIRQIILKELINEVEEREIINPEDFFKTLRILSKNEIFCEQDYDENLKQEIFACLINTENKSQYERHFFHEFFKLFATTNHQNYIIENLNQLHKDKAKVKLCLAFLDHNRTTISTEEPINDEKNDEAIANISNFLENETIKNLFLKKKDFAKELLDFIDKFSTKLPDLKEAANPESSNKKKGKNHPLLESEKKLELFFPNILELRKNLERVARPSTIVQIKNFTKSLKLQRKDSTNSKDSKGSKGSK